MAQPASESLPFQPLRRSVYTPRELFDGFDPARHESWAGTRDFLTYQWFVRTGRNMPVDSDDATLRALHDSSLTFELGSLIAGRRVAAIMGGHRMSRDSAEYLAIAQLARDLARRDMLVLSGGGPGAMEAAHLGAELARHPDAALSAAVGSLSAQPDMPAIGGVVRPDGSADLALVEAAHAWFAPAWELSSSLHDRTESLSIPTWHYGHEPTTPFASKIAKLFQNSIREDGLLTIARQGIVFTQGSGGTLHEVFQDAEQNFYAAGAEYFSPMVFLDVDYWTRVLPVVPLMNALFATASEEVRRSFGELVLVTDDIAAAAAHLDAFSVGPGEPLAATPRSA